MKKILFLFSSAVVMVSLLAIIPSENHQGNMGRDEKQMTSLPAAKETGTKVQVLFPTKQGQHEKVLFIEGPLELTRIMLLATCSDKVDAAVFAIKTSRKKYSYFLENIDEAGLWTEGFQLTFTYGPDQPAREKIANMFLIRNHEGKATARFDCATFPGDVAKINVRCRFHGEFTDFNFTIERTGLGVKHFGQAAGVGRTIEVATPLKLPKWED